LGGYSRGALRVFLGGVGGLFDIPSKHFYGKTSP
jgi:hypothetical protein